jgi:hypothetical protein
MKTRENLNLIASIVGSPQSPYITHANIPSKLLETEKYKRLEVLTESCIKGEVTFNEAETELLEMGFDQQYANKLLREWNNKRLELV